MLFAGVWPQGWLWGHTGYHWNLIGHAAWPPTTRTVSYFVVHIDYISNWKLQIAHSLPVGGNNAPFGCLPPTNKYKKKKKKLQTVKFKVSVQRHWIKKLISWPHDYNTKSWDNFDPRAWHRQRWSQILTLLFWIVQMYPVPHTYDYCCIVRLWCIQMYF